MPRGKQSSIDIRPMVDNSAATSAEGLRRFALTYKSTVQGKIDLEKFRIAANSKAMKKPFDPRFRRTRVDHGGDTSGTKSDTKVPSPYHKMKPHPSSVPMVSSMPSSPKRSPRKKSRILSAVSPVESDTGVEDDCLSTRKDNTDVEIEAYVKKLEKARPRRMKSMIERSCTMDLKPFTTADAGISVDLKAPMPSRETIHQCDEQIETEKTKYSSGDAYRTFDTYLSPPLEIKPDAIPLPKSVVTLPFSAPATAVTEHRQCFCNECMYIMKKKNMPFSECTTSLVGTNTIIEALEYSKELRENEEHSLWVMWCLYAFGCLLGLILVSCLAWIVSSDTLWNWVNHKSEPPPENKFFLYSIMTTCGAAVVSTVNLVIGTLYKIFMLPRNSVFGSDDAEFDNFW